MAANRPPSLPNGLAGVLNHPEDGQRDSAYYSAVDSKHASLQSSVGHHALTPPASTFLDSTPSPINTSVGGLHSPGSGGAMPLNNMISPTTENYLTHNRQSTEIGGEALSRRESVNSAFDNKFSTLGLANSPYASHNQSTASLQADTLQRHMDAQRNPGNANSGSRLSNGNGYDLSSGHRVPDVVSPARSFRDDALSQARKAKTAPAITGAAPKGVRNAPRPTAGQAWAFPEEEIQHLGSVVSTVTSSHGGRSSDNINRANTSFLDSRRSSIADSVTSSVYTTESYLPNGQRRLEDGHAPDFVASNRLSRNSSAFGGDGSSDFDGSTHHHHLHKTVSHLRSNAGSPSGSQPYSRTPELRVSHKLAERKRRTEMKDLFDNLRDLMPQERGTKASKWEILTKAIAEYTRLNDKIRSQQHEIATLRKDLDQKKHECDTRMVENNQLRDTLSRYEREREATMFRMHPTTAAFSPLPEHMYPPHSGAELPPLRIQPGDAGAMADVQYGQRAPGYGHQF